CTAHDYSGRAGQSGRGHYRRLCFRAAVRMVYRPHQALAVAAGRLYYFRGDADALWPGRPAPSTAGMACSQRKQGRRNPMTTAILEARNVTRKFGALLAVNNVSLQLFEGEILAVIGTNGAGKSTLTYLLSGELPLS